MTDSSNNPNRWIDGELRRVPVPDGLLARLRKIAENGADDALDEQIGAVELPDGLLARLALIPDDEPLDRRINEVPLPAGLLASLAQIPDDDLLDEAIRSVPVPGTLVPSTAAAVRRSATIGTLRQWSVAAAALIAVGVGYLAMLDQFSGIIDNGGTNVAGLPENADEGAEPFDDEVFDLPAGVSPRSAAGRDLLADVDLWGPDADAANAPMNPIIADVDRELRRPTAFDIAASWPALDDPRGALQGAAPHSLDLPPLEAARPVAPQGVAPPSTPQFDRVALARTGVHPFVNPSAHPLLESSAAPLVRSTASFDALRWRLHEEHVARQSPRHRADAQDVLSSASVRVRTEEFLAAMRYDFPPPTASALAIRTSAGPSPFAASNVRLLQIGVQSKTLAASSRSPVDLTIAVDVSSRMGADGRLEIVRHALVDMLDRLRAEDRVTLVASGIAENVLAQRVSPSNPILRRAISRLAVDPQTTLPSVIARAAAMARSPSAADAESSVRRQMIVFADAPTYLTPAQRSESRRALTSATGDGIAVAMVDLSQGAVADSDLAGLADAADAEFDLVSSTAGASRALDKALFARSTAVANDVDLSVRFNPRSVASYRLVGHESMLGLPTAPAKISLRSGESAAVLFEVVLRDDGTNDVGVAELEWIDPESGAKHVLTQPISRVQFANSLAESSISLQAAAVAAEAAEILRGARAASPSGEHSLERTLEVARAVHPRLRDQPEFRALVEVIERARQSGIGRNSP
jgi:Ca-activated chloride channel family protein